MRKRLFKFILVFFILITMPFGSNLYPQNQGWRLSGPPGGVVSEVAIISNNPNAIIAANMVPFIGLMKSTDNGESWKMLNEGLEIVVEGDYSAIYAFAADIVFPDTMFISIRTSYSTYGFYKTYNGGENWQIIMEDKIFRAIAAKNGQIYASPGSGGLLASFDGGENWQDIAPSLPLATHIIFDPKDQGSLYVGTYDNGLYRRSTNGRSFFEHIGFPGERVTALDVASLDSCKLICAAIGYSDGDSVFISLDDGNSWIPRNNGLPPIEPFGPVKSMLISFQNQDILYAGTTDGVYKTADQGLNWFPVNEGLEIHTILFPQPEPVTVLVLAMDPDDPNIIHAGTDGKGLFKTMNGGNSWFLEGIPVTPVTGLSVSPLNPEFVYAGTDDGICVKRQGRWTPTTLWGGVTSGRKSVASSPIDSNMVIASYNNAIFTPLIYKSTDGGQAWEMTQVLFDGSDVLDFVFDPEYPMRVYGIWWWELLNKGGLIISDDGGDTWEIVELDSVELGADVIKPLAVNPDDTDELYLLDKRGTVYQSTDRALTWTKVRTKIDTTHCAIAIDPFNHENIYLGTYSVWRSPDGGDTWSRTGLNEWVLDLAFDENSGYLYAATYGNGVFFTTDGGESWDSLEIPPNPYLRTIDIGEGENCSKIYVGSFGPGVFEWSEELTQASPPEINNKSPNGYILPQNHPNPFNERTCIEFRVPKPAQVSLRIINIRGQAVCSLVNEYKPAGEYAVYWDGKNDAGKKVASGVYFYFLKYGNLSKAKKLLLIK